MRGEVNAEGCGTFNFGFRISDLPARGNVGWLEVFCPRLGFLSGRGGELGIRNYRRGEVGEEIGAPFPRLSAMGEGCVIC